jgi:hypothetical protein
MPVVSLVAGKWRSGRQGFWTNLQNSKKEKVKVKKLK